MALRPLPISIHLDCAPLWCVGGGGTVMKTLSRHHSSALLQGARRRVPDWWRRFPLSWDVGRADGEAPSRLLEVSNPAGGCFRGAAWARHLFEEDLDLIRPRGSSKTGLKTKAAANLPIGEH